MLETVPFSPPATIERIASARFSRPPVTEAAIPLAVLFVPPVTEEWIPLAVLPCPPVTEEKGPLTVLACPAMSPAKLVQWCPSPMMGEWEPARSLAEVPVKEFGAL